MSPRQQRLFLHLRPYLTEVYQQAVRELADWPVGWSWLARVPAPWMGGSMTGLSLHIVKADRDFLFRIDEPHVWHRKGRCAPKWRRLHA